MAWVVTAIAGATGLATGTVAAIGGTLIGAGISARATGKAAETAAKGQEKSQAAVDAAAEAARFDINRLFGKAADTRKDAFGRTLDFLSGAPSRQIDPFQQGSLAAQETTAAGLPQIQRAILGLPTDLSQIRPRSITGDFDVDISKFRPALPAALPAPQPNIQITAEQLALQNALPGRNKRRV